MLANNKIAFVIHGFPMGGAEKFLINIVNHFYGKGYLPLVISLSEDKALIHELDSRVKVLTIIKRSRLDLSVSKRIKAAIKEEGITKIFCVNTYAFFLTKIAFLFDKSTQFYLSVHSTIPATTKNFWQNFIYFRALTRHDMVIYLCHNQKNYLRKKYLFSIGGETVIYNGIDTDYFDLRHFKGLDVNGLRAEYQLSPDDKVIIKVARLHPEKGHFNAIEALEILHHQYNTKAHLLFVGGGEPAYKQSLEEYADKKGLAGHVHFAGNQQDVRKFYCASDMFTLTSYSIETFSLAALEAMAFGLPCSLTDIGGAKEMTIEGETGSVSQPKDPASIAGSWNRILLKNLKGENIRQYVLDNFTSGKMLQQYIELVGKNRNTQ